jgi:hypothetical protein
MISVCGTKLRTVSGFQNENANSTYITETGLTKFQLSWKILTLANWQKNISVKKMFAFQRMWAFGWTTI